MSEVETLDREISEIKTAIAADVKAASEIRESAQRNSDGTLEVDEETGAKYGQLIDGIKSKRVEMDGMTELKSAGEYLSAPARSSFAVEEHASGLAEVKSIGARFLDSPEYKAMVDAKATKMDQPFEISGDILERKDVYSSLPTGTPASFGTVQRDPMVERAKRGVRVRDLFPAQATTAAVIEYFRVSGFTSSAQPVAERDGSAFALKPQSTITFSGQQATVRTIAHWEAAHRNVLADEPQLQGIIESELLYGLRLEEDDQILNGDGTGENLEGVLQVSGINTITQGAGDSPATDNKADVIRRAMTTNELAYYPSTGVVLHPRDWEDVELQKSADDGHYLFVSAPGLQLQGPRIWGVSVVTTPAIAEGTALVGAFGLGAQLYDREQSTIRVTDSHSDFFIRNAVVVLAEQRLALATKRPEAFTAVTFS